MARTHGASQRFHQDDGVVLGKGGAPIPTTPVRGVATLNPHGAPKPAPAVQHMDDGEIVPPPGVDVPAAAEPAVSYAWVCDKTTWQRNMDGWQALQLLNVMLKDMLGSELSATLTQEQMGRLPADTRWHFRRKMIVAPVDPIEGDGSEANGDAS